MGDADVSASHDRWGEPLADQPRQPRPARRAYLFWGLVAAGTIAVLIGAYYAGKQLLIQRLSESCREALRKNDFQRLGRLAERWHAWDHAKAAPLVYLAEVANEAKQYGRAVDLLDQLPDNDPMTPPALLERSAMLFEALNRPLEGAETLERALRLNPRMTEARRRLIYFYAFTFQRRKVAEHAYAAIHYDCDLPETYVYLMLRDHLSFANAYDENTKWSRGNPGAEVFIVARALYRVTARGLDERNDASTDGPPAPDGTPYHRKILADLFRRYPHNLELTAYYLNRAMARGDAEEVARLLSGAPAEGDLDNRIWRCRGWLHAVRGELHEAEACYRKALALVCYDHVTRHQLASVERRLRRLDLVKPLEDLSFEGKELRRDLLMLPAVNKVPVPMLRRMAQYAKRCGDDIVADKLALQVRRLEEAAKSLSQTDSAAKPKPKRKHQARNPKCQTNPRLQMPMSQTSCTESSVGVLDFGSWSLGFVSDFGFGISDFLPEQCNA